MLTSNDVGNVAFTVVKWGVGYEIDDVSVFLAGVRDTLAGYEARRPVPIPVTSLQAHKTAFNPTQFREGWAQGEVDRYRKQIVATLREYEAGP
jgi:DivIVA domain-containing protein